MRKSIIYLLVFCFFITSVSAVFEPTLCWNFDSDVANPLESCAAPPNDYRIETLQSDYTASGNISGGRDYEYSNTDYDVVNSSTRLSLSGSSISIGGWFTVESYPGAGSYNGFIFSQTGTPSENYMMVTVKETSNNLGCAIFGAAPLESTVVPTLNQWYHVVCTYDGTTLKVYVNGVLNNSVGLASYSTETSLDNIQMGGFNSVNRHDGKIDEPFIHNGVMTATEVNEVYNRTVSWGTVVSSAKFDLTASDIFIGSSINTFNATVNGTFYSTTNGTINTNIDSSGGFVNISNVSSDLYQIISYNGWNVSESLGANLTRYYYAGVIHESPKIETESNTLLLRVNITSEVSDVSAQLLWNSTTYSATKSSSTDHYNFSVTFNTPEIDSDTVFNLTWTFNITSNGSINNFDLNSTQQIVEFGIDNCSVNTFQAINFTLYNESNNQEISGSFSGYMTAYIDSVAESRAVNLTWGDSTSFGVCIDPEDVLLLSEGQFEYSSSGFADETYYITNYLLDNITNHVSLYLTEGTTQVTLSVTDENDDPVENAYIQVAKYDLSTNSFQVTEIHKTDSSGQAIGNIVLLTEWYKFFIYYNNELLLETSPEKLTSATRNFRVNFGSDFYDTYGQALGVSCTLSYNNATSTFLLVFSDDGGSSREACVKVTSRTGTGDTVVNNSCKTTSGGTVTVIHSPTNKTLIASSYVNLEGVSYTCGSPVSYTFDKDFETFGSNGVFFVFLIVLTLVMVGIFNPMMSIVLSLLGLLGGYFLGLVYFSWGALIAFIAIGIIALFRMGRE